MKSSQGSRCRRSALRTRTGNLVTARFESKQGASAHESIDCREAFLSEQRWP